MGGPVTWYEAHIKSGQGWNTIGGVFPGSPLILHGHNEKARLGPHRQRPRSGRCLSPDHAPDKPLHYRYGDSWQPLTVKQAPLPIDTSLFEITLHRDVYFSVHGPVVKTDAGYFALRYSGHEGPDSRLRAVVQDEQGADACRVAGGDAPPFAADVQHRLRRPRQRLLRLQRPHTGSRPVADYSRVLPGDDPRLVWDRYLPFERLPQIQNPASGFVLSCNSTPFAATEGPENPRPDDFPATALIERRAHQSLMRALKLLSGTAKLSRQDFLTMVGSQSTTPPRRFIPKGHKAAPPELRPRPRRDAGAGAARTWDGGTDEDSVPASVATLAIRHIFYMHDLDGDKMLTRTRSKPFSEPCASA